jgi:hypothetical protein
MMEVEEVEDGEDAAVAEAEGVGLVAAAEGEEEEGEMVDTMIGIVAMNGDEMDKTEVRRQGDTTMTMVQAGEVVLAAGAMVGLHTTIVATDTVLRHHTAAPVVPVLVILDSDLQTVTTWAPLPQVGPKRALQVLHTPSLLQLLQ